MNQASEAIVTLAPKKVIASSEANISTPLGIHYLAECHNCDPELIYNAVFIESLLNSTAKHCNATIVDSKFHHFEPYGVSGVVIIEESHFHVHTWPEHGYAAIDLFTCDLSLDFKKAIEHLEEKLACSPIKYQTLKRGLIPGLNN